MTSSRITTWVNRFIGADSFIGDNLLIDAQMKGVRSVYVSRLVGLALWTGGEHVRRGELTVHL